jgi:hypothetical protein
MASYQKARRPLVRVASQAGRAAVAELRHQVRGLGLGDQAGGGARDQLRPRLHLGTRFDRGADRPLRARGEAAQALGQTRDYALIRLKEGLGHIRARDLAIGHVLEHAQVRQGEGAGPVHLRMEAATSGWRARSGASTCHQRCRAMPVQRAGDAGLRQPRRPRRGPRLRARADTVVTSISPPISSTTFRPTSSSRAKRTTARRPTPYLVSLAASRRGLKFRST